MAGTQARAEPAKKGTKKKALPPLALAALGIVFGDIGTSPLYAFQTVFAAPHGITPQPDRIYGALSLIFWTITLIVTVKYVLIVMRADNNGEGGIMALTALTMLEKFKTKRRKIIMIGLGVFGAALFYGDSMITPAISVLSAVEGLEIAAPNLADFVIPIAIAVLVGLFAVQRFGTGKVGRAFGPIMVVWFLAIAAAGLYSIVQTPEILQAISPTWAINLFVQEPLIAFLSLGSVILCVTGAEALYADMGHFGKGPIRISWFMAATPALYLNYLGQGALVVRNPSEVSSPFYHLFPDSIQLPMVLLATVATVIASQAVISGAFSLTQQAMRLRYVPRMTVRHTSASSAGQIYVPFVNWVLLISVVLLVIGFQDSSNLAAAYGLAVSGTFVITTLLISVVARQRWKVPRKVVVPITIFFLIIDIAFFAANMTKFLHGGYFPVLIAVLVFVIFTTWSRGRVLLRRKTEEIAMDQDEVVTALASDEVVRTPGTRVYLTLNEQVPLALSINIQRLHSVAENTIMLAALSAKVPYVDYGERIKASEWAPGLENVRVYNGFMQPLWTPLDIRKAKERGYDLTGDVIFVVHSIRVQPTKAPGMARWRKVLFAYMMHNASDPARYFRLPNDRVVEYSSVVEI